jgi:sugar phosphate isomerase/epimerase
MISLGFSTIACPDYDVDGVIALAKANGCAGVEIRFLRGTTDLTSLPEFSPAGLADTRRRFADAGIDVFGIDTGVRMAALDPATRDQQMADARANLAIAEALGARYLRVFGGPLPPEQDRERTLDAIAAGLGAVADMTAEHGVTTLIETHDAFCRSDSILDLYRRGASANLAVLWDTLHTWRFGETAAETYARIGDRVRHVHVKDSTVANSERFDFALPGEGVVPILSFVDLLEARGYDGYVSFEWEKGWHPEIAGPEIAIPHFARFMATRAPALTS